MIERRRGPGFSTLAIHAGIQNQILQHQILQNQLPQHPATQGIIPICSGLEERIATLEGGSAAVAVAAGKATNLVVLHALLQPGDTFIASRHMFARAGDQFDLAFKAFGWQVEWADPERPESFVEALGDRTKAILIDSIGDQGAVTDIEPIASIARRARVPLVVDNTFATPYLLRPLEHGADIVVHATTQLLAGHADAVGGLIVDGGTFEWSGEDRYPSISQPQTVHGGTSLADTYGNFAFAVACRQHGLRQLGATLVATDAARVRDGIETLALRMQRHCDNALAVARHLSRHPAVSRVHYAGLDDDPAHVLADHLCPSGCGAAFTFRLAEGHAAAALMSGLALFSPLAEIGDARSRIAHPASVAPQCVDVDPTVVHVSIGLEDAADIIADLDKSLAT